MNRGITIFAALGIFGVVIVVLLGFGTSVMFTSAVTGDVAKPDVRPQGQPTHKHGPDGDVIAVPISPPRPDVERLLEPVLDSNGEQLVGDGDGKVSVDVNAQAAAIKAWIEDGGDLAVDPVPSAGADLEWWFGAPESHPGDPRWWLVFSVEHVWP